MDKQPQYAPQHNRKALIKLLLLFLIQAFLILLFFAYRFPRFWEQSSIYCYNFINWQASNIDIQLYLSSFLPILLSTINLLLNTKHMIHAIKYQQFPPPKIKTYVKTKYHYGKPATRRAYFMLLVLLTHFAGLIIITLIFQNFLKTSTVTPIFCENYQIN